MNQHMLNAMGANGAFPWDELARLCTLAALGMAVLFLAALVLEGLSAAFEDEALHAAPHLVQGPMSAPAFTPGLWASSASAARSTMLAAVSSPAQQESVPGAVDAPIDLSHATHSPVDQTLPFDPTTLARLEFARWRMRRGLLSEHPSGEPPAAVSPP